MSTNGKSRLILRDHLEPKGPAVDAKGRNLNRAPDLRTVYEIVAEETAKVHEYYLNQIPQFVARMIQDALLGYGLIQLSDEAKLAAAGGGGEVPTAPGSVPAAPGHADPVAPESAPAPPVADVATDGSEGDE